MNNDNFIVKEKFYSKTNLYKLEECKFAKSGPGTLWCIHEPTWLGGLHFGVQSDVIFTEEFQLNEYSFATSVDYYDLQTEDIILKVGIKEPDPFQTHLFYPDYFHKVLVTTGKGELVEGWLSDSAICHLDRLDENK